jgi:hypothetical protein
MHVSIYVQGDRNSLADALLQQPVGTSGITSKQAEKKAHQPYSPSQPDADDFDPEDNGIIAIVTALSDTVFEPRKALTLSISADRDFLNLLCKGYETDPWTKLLLLAMHSIQGLKKQDDLWFLNNQLIIPMPDIFKKLYIN